MHMSRGHEPEGEREKERERETETEKKIQHLLSTTKLNETNTNQHKKKYLSVAGKQEATEKLVAGSFADALT